jgi:CspA family cold shock protein
MRERGKVKWFNDAKGYGFISRDSGEGDLFVHFSSVNAEGFKTLKPDQQVEFDVVASEKGFKAENVTPLS